MFDRRARQQQCPHCQSCPYCRYCECRRRYRLYAQPPAEIIQRVLALAKYPLASPTYRRLMAYVDAALFAHPEYRELTELTAAVRREMGDRQ